MYYIGVDLGGTNIAIGIVDKSLNIIDKGSVPTKAERHPDLIVKDMCELASRLLAKNNIPLDDVEYVGIASPGTANSETGIIEYCNNIDFRDYPIAETFKKFLPAKQVYVGNDANAAALGENLAGSAKGSRYSVMITLGTGVGGGIIIDGKIYSGFNMAGGELGHTVIVDGGRQCSCGRRGCVEAYCSATALVKMTEEKLFECRTKNINTLMFEEVASNGGRANARTAFSAMKKGDDVAKEVVDTYIRYLACSVSNFINIFQPEVLSIGGGICNEKDWLLLPLIDIVEHEQYTRNNSKKPKIVIATLGNDAGIIGAAGLGMQK